MTRAGGDATVTRRGDDPDMSDPGETLGILLIRVWRASSAPDAPLVARLVGRLDTERGDDEPAEYAAGIDEILAATHAWLDRYQRMAPRD